ncbi:TetR/AcrR family transcriptional regulator [Proteus vulgaris]|uniref:TetR/AcrR family transcriptional regulator n=1 Tax=Proteus vulgaris TaxID=585 RepID=UPI001B36C9CA|nr:TetR/AcrR family transcriptional regulator [Proteus vulgaris]MBQ0214765.1 TetR/AcrR family transcriptional regulator [Proteus vulgaris]MDS0786541.1 TetR/AcrR family transcriptional regulator [Proteus vulgaris]
MTDSKINQKRGRPARPQEEIRQEIYEATISLLLEQGYNATTIDAIAKQASIAKKTIYRFTKDKEDLVEQIVLSWTDSFVAIFHDKATNFDEFILLLSQHLNSIVQTVLNHKAVGLYKLLQEDFPSREVLMEKYQRSGILRGRSLLTQWLQQQEKNGIIRSYDYATLSDLLLAMVIAEPLRQIALGIVPPTPKSNFDLRIQQAIQLITPVLKP